MKNLWIKYKEPILYIVFGVLTTLVNFIVFWLLSRFINEKYYLLTNIAAWVAAVAFAFVTNKLFVFEAKNSKSLFKEIIEFAAARVFSLLVEEGGLYLLVDLLGFGAYNTEILGFDISGQLIAKAILTVIVIIMNYFFSKFIIFKKPKASE